MAADVRVTFAERAQERAKRLVMMAKGLEHPDLVEKVRELLLDMAAAELNAADRALDLCEG